MPPKAPKKAKAPTVIDIDQTKPWELTFEELQIFCKMVNDELAKEMKIKEDFHFEAAKVLNYWLINSHHTRNYVNELSKVERLREDFVDENLLKIKQADLEFVAKNYEESEKQREVLIGKMIEMSKCFVSTFQQEKQLSQDVHNLKRTMTDMSRQYFAAITEFDMDHMQRKYDITEEKSSVFMDNEAILSIHLHKITEKIREQNLVRIIALRSDREKELSSVMGRQAKDILDIKEVYENIVSHNFILVQNLKQELTKQKYEEGRVRKDFLKIKSEHDKVLSELMNLRELGSTTAGELHHYERNKEKLQKTVRRCEHRQEKIDIMELEMSMEEQNRESLKEELKEKRDLFTIASMNTYENAYRKFLILESIVKDLVMLIRLYDLAMNSSPDESSFQTSNASDIIRKSMRQLARIDELEMELEESRMTRLNLIRLYDQIAGCFGVDINTLGFQLVKTKWKCPKSQFRLSKIHLPQ